MADDRGEGPSSRLRIGCVFRSRKGTFCRVLHTQVLEVIKQWHSDCGAEQKITTTNPRSDYWL